MEPSSAHIEKLIHCAWDRRLGATSGTQAVAIPVPPFTRVGMLICADAYSPEIAKTLHNQGAQILVSSAAWAPGLHGPNGEWERCTFAQGSRSSSAIGQGRTGRSIFVKLRVWWSRMGTSAVPIFSAFGDFRNRVGSTSSDIGDHGIQDRLLVIE